MSRMNGTNPWAQYLKNQVVSLVLLLLFIVPILFGGSFANRTGQVITSGFLALVLLAAWLLRAQDGLTKARVQTFLKSGPNAPIFLYLGWLVLAAATSVDVFSSKLALIQVAFGTLIYAMVVYQFRHRTQVKTLLTGVLVIGVALVLVALAMDMERRLLDLAGSFHDRQLFGSFLCLILPLIIGVAAGSKNRVYRMGAGVAGILVAGALVLTRCRSSWIGAAVAVVFFIALCGYFVWSKGGFGRRKHDLLLTPILVAAALGVFVWFTGVGSAVQFRATTFQNLQKDDSVRDRQQLWQVALKAIAARPLTGWGPGTYWQAQIPFNPQSRSEAVIRATGPSLSESPHNTYLQIAAEQGVPGLAIFLAILGAFFVTGLRALSRLDTGLRKFVLMGALAAVLGHAVDAVANPGPMFPEVQLFFWLVMGVGMCAAGLGQEAEQTAVRKPGEVVLGVPLFLYRGMRTATIACAGLFFATQMLGLQMISAAQAGGGGGASRPAYAEDLDPGDIIGPAVGTVAGAAGVAALMGGAAGGELFPLTDDEHRCKERLPELPAGMEGGVTAIRLQPSNTSIPRGMARCFHLEVRASDGNWYSVTNSPNTQIGPEGDDPRLARGQHAGNSFGVPQNVTGSETDQVVRVVARWSPPGFRVWTAQASVRIPPAR